MSSCTSNDPAEPVIDAEVEFVVSDLSRTSVTNDIGYNNSKFAIYGDMKFKDNLKTTIFDNVIVRYSDGIWGYNDPQYWFPGHVHSFIAMYPYTTDGVSDTRYSDSRLSFKYTAPDDFRSATDLMVATHRRLVDSIPTSKDLLPIYLKFWHITSRVNFQLINDGAADIVRVTEIKLEGVNKTGTFAISPASLLSGSSQTDDYDFSWTDISNKGTITANLFVDVPENEACPLFPDNDALLIVPQPDNNGVIMHITYTLIDDGANDKQFTLTAQAPIGGWESGKSYIYSITVSEITKEICLTVSVKDWQTAANNKVPVPES